MASVMTSTKVRATWPRLSRIVFVLVAFVFAGDALAQRAIPEDNLAYPVLITVKKDQKTFGMASGFYLTSDGAVYLVTAGHVLKNVLTPDPQTQKLPDVEIDLLSYSRDQTPKRIVLTLNLAVLRESGAVKLHASHDVAVVRIATASNRDSRNTNQFLPGVTAKESVGGPLFGIAMGAIKTFDQVLVGNDAIVYGYPVSLGFEQFPQFENDRPLLRKALIAGLNNQKRTIIVDGPSHPGNSGGPVFQIERSGAANHFPLIGVVVSHIPFVRSAINSTADVALMVAFNSGYSVVEPMEFVLELINQEVATSSTGPRVAVSTMATVSRIAAPAPQTNKTAARPAKNTRKSPTPGKRDAKLRRREAK